MAAPYIPARESELDEFLLNFSTLLSADPARYGLTEDDALAVAAAYTAWHTAYVTAISPSTRTSAAVRTKDNERARIVPLVRRCATAVKVNPVVSNDLKIGLGVRPRSFAHTRCPAPATAPRLMVSRLNVGSHTLFASDEESESRGKPPNTVGLLLFRTIAEDAVSRPTGAEFLGFVTRPTFVSEFSRDQSGKFATYFARWTNAKGEMGPWSTGSCMRIAA